MNYFIFIRPLLNLPELNIQNIKRSEKLLTLSGMTDELKLSTPQALLILSLSLDFPYYEN